MRLPTMKSNISPKKKIDSDSTKKCTMDCDSVKKMLADHGISDVKVISTPGRLTDHYNPVDKTVNLSEAVYNQRNAAAAAVAAQRNLRRWRCRTRSPLARARWQCAQPARLPAAAGRRKGRR